jgi:hypothetical protein
MDQSIGAALTQCANLYKQRRLAQQVVVPVTLNFHFEGPDPLDASFQDTVDVTAQGQLLYAPQQAVEYSPPTSGRIGSVLRLALIPETLTAILQGRGAAQTASVGGDFAVPAIHVSISGALPLENAGPGVAVQSSVDLQCNFTSAFGETVLPIELTKSDSTGNSIVVLHLGNAELVAGPVMFGPVKFNLAG